MNKPVKEDKKSSHNAYFQRSKNQNVVKEMRPQYLDSDNRMPICSHMINTKIYPGDVVGGAPVLHPLHPVQNPSSLYY